MVGSSRDVVARRLIAGAGGRQTQPRIAVLMALLQSGRAVSHGELHRRLPDLDRVTLYRALDWLAEHKLAHRLADADGIRRYAPSLPSEVHDHPHFQCSKCGLTTCLDSLRLPAYQLPGGFHPAETKVLIKGLCKICASVA